MSETKLIEFEGEWMVVGYRTLDGREAVNEIHRIVESEGVIARVRAYCFCPETLGVVAEQLGRPVVQRRLPHRSPSLPDIPRLLWHHLTTRRA